MLPVYRFHNKASFEIYIFSGLDIPTNRKDVENLKKYGQFIKIANLSDF